MASHQTIVVELGSSRIKVGFAGESKPRRVLDDDGIDSAARHGGCAGWTVGVNDGMVSRACKWTSLFRYSSMSASSSSNNTSHDEGNDGSTSAFTTAYEWERTLYPLFSHILTSILFIQRPPRHRMLLMISDSFPPRIFHEALHRVLLDYLNVGSVWLLNGGAFEGAYHLLEGLPPPPPSIPPSSGPPRAHLLVDIGTQESRVVVSVAGSSILPDTHRATASGYNSFLCQVLANYRERITTDDEVDEGAQLERDESESPVTSLEDANAVVRAFIALSSSPAGLSSESTTIQVRLPSLERARQTNASMGDMVQLPIQPLLEAFYQIYLDFSNPMSLIFAMLASVMSCPIDYRKAAMQHSVLLGGGSVALRHFRFPRGPASMGNSANGLCRQLEVAARDACGVSSDESMDESKEKEEKKDDGTSSMSSIAKKRFQSLGGAVNGYVNDAGDRIGGINIQYPDPFAADTFAWVGGSIMGTLGYSQYYQNKFP